jgi:S1-C subfamily serine protease
MKKRILLVMGAAIGAALVLGAALFATVNVAQAAARVGRDLITGRTENLVQDVLQASTDQKGLVVVLVTADSPADKAGLKRGDIILKADSTEVNNNGDLQKYLATKKISDTVDLSITHGDTPKTVTATLTDKNGKAYLGVVAFGTDFGRMGGMFGKGMRGPDFNIPISGTHVLVTEVVTDSPASGAGIRVGDVILSVDGKTFGTNETLSGIIGSHKVGDNVILSVQHQGDANPTDVTVKLGDNPSKAGAPYLGVQYRMGGFGRRGMMPFGRQGRNPGIEPGTTITPTNPRGNSQLPQRIPGAIVFVVTEGSPAAKAGLQRSDVISAIDGKSVENAQALVDAIATYKPNSDVTLTVKHRNDAATTEVKVTLGENPDKSGSAYLGVSLADAMSMPRLNVNPGNGSGANNNGRPNFRNPNTNPQQQGNGNTL